MGVQYKYPQVGRRYGWYGKMGHVPEDCPEPPGDQALRSKGDDRWSLPDTAMADGGWGYWQEGTGKRKGK